MNNYVKLPEVINTDVDIAIDNGTFKKLDVILLDIAAQHNIEIVQKIWHGYNKCAYILSPLTINERFRLQLDFFTDFSIKGYPNLISNEILLENKQKYKNFYIPKPETEIIFSIMRRITKNDLDLSHIKNWETLLKRDPERIKMRIHEVLGKELGNSTIQIIETRDLLIFKQKIDLYRKKLKNWSRKNSNFTYLIKYYIHQAKRALNRFLHPVGFSIVLLGPDGSGKSTIAKSVLERVSGSFHGGKIQYWRPNLLPPMGKLKFWNPAMEIISNPNPHDHVKQNVLKSMFRFFYYLLDYIIGYPTKIYWDLVRKKIVIFDRYYYDYLIDLHRYHFNIPAWIPKILLPFIPSPDLIIYLDSDAIELYNRKKELTLCELKRQTEEYRKSIRYLPNLIVVKTDRKIKEITKHITYLILKKKAQQTYKILQRK